MLVVDLSVGTSASFLFHVPPRALERLCLDKISGCESGPDRAAVFTEQQRASTSVTVNPRQYVGQLRPTRRFGVTLIRPLPPARRPDDRHQGINNTHQVFRERSWHNDRLRKLKVTNAGLTRLIKR